MNRCTNIWIKAVLLGKPNNYCPANIVNLNQYNFAPPLKIPARAETV